MNNALAKKMQPVIEKMAKEKGISAVLIANSGRDFYIDPDLIITEEVVKAFTRPIRLALPKPQPLRLPRPKNSRNRMNSIRPAGSLCRPDTLMHSKKTMERSFSTQKINEILRILPQRYPFLLVDRILETDGLTYMVGLKNVTINEPFFRDTFPSTPLCLECSWSKRSPRWASFYCSAAIRAGIPSWCIFRE